MFRSCVDKYGEVFTPLSLVRRMFSLFPESIWRNKDYLWIDHSCGNGSFLLAAKNILRQYYDEQHVINNMLWGIDIRRSNIEMTRQSTGIKNLLCQDALKYKSDFKFNVVVGNPPYNNPKKGKKGNNTNPLWPLFVDLSLDRLLADGGYLLQVHPPLWRKPEYYLWDKFKQIQVDKLVILSQKVSTEIFGVMTKVDFYLARKIKPYKETEIVDEFGKSCNIKIYDKPFVPNSNIEKVYKVFSGKNEVLYSCSYHHHTQRHMSKEEDELHKYKCVYLRDKDKITYYYSSRDDLGHFGVPKIIIPMGRFDPILDLSGKYGMCEVSFGLPIENINGYKLYEKLKSPEFTEILNSCRWKTVQTDYRLFKYLNIRGLLHD